MKVLLATAVVVLLVAGCGGTEQATGPASPSPASSMDSAAPTRTASPSTSSTTPDLPDNPGPSRVPFGSRKHVGQLGAIWIRTENGLDRVDFWFGRPTPRCTVRRVLSIPPGSPPVNGAAFLVVRCAPAVMTGRVRIPVTDPVLAQNVAQVVLTRADSRVVVVTIGLRHVAGWGVNSFGYGPVVWIEQ